MRGLALGLVLLAAPASGQVALVGGTVYTTPESPAVADGVVVIVDGRIAAAGRRGSVRVPRGMATLDCSGLTIAAGFWNSHVHFFERKWTDAANLPGPELQAQVQAMLTRYGFTSVFDLGSPWENTRRIQSRIESGEIAGPRIRSTGPGLIGKGWLPPDIVLRTLGFMLFPAPEVEDGPGASAAAKKILDEGADGLKIFAAAQSPPYATLPADAIRAAVEEAHRRNRLVFAHPTIREGLLAAVRGGVDVMAHTTPQSDVWDEAIVREMRQAKIALIPTLKMWKFLMRHERASRGEIWKRNSIGQLREWVAAGGVVLFGTDVGGMDDYDPGEEYEMMAAAGMTYRQILASLTTAPAERFGESERLGRIAPGLTADLVVLGIDPARDVRGFAKVRYLLRDGRVIYRAK